MTTNDPMQERSTVQLPTDAFRLGVDAAGNTHYHSRIRDRMYVVGADGVIEDVQGLEGAPLTDWIAFVEEQLGAWETCRYDPDGIAALTERVVEGVQ